MSDLTNSRAKSAIKVHKATLYRKGENMEPTEEEKNENLIRAQKQREWLDSMGINRTLPSKKSKAKSALGV